MKSNTGIRVKAESLISRSNMFEVV